MAGRDLPEDVIENIFSRLPTKSLIQFTCLSKHYYSLILSDPVFAKTQRKLASGHSRLLISSNSWKLGSIGLDTLSFEDDIREPNFLFHHCGIPIPLGSCNGLVFLILPEGDFFVCNPSTSLFKKLPSKKIVENHNFGVGYLSANDDYKVVTNHTVTLDEYLKEECIEDEYFLQDDVEGDDGDDEECCDEPEWAMIFSLRDMVWERMKCPSHFVMSTEGTLLNETLHWLNDARKHKEMVVFDLAKEEFRAKQLPYFDQDGNHLLRRPGKTVEGRLCVLCYYPKDCDSLCFWVMQEYEVDDPWVQLYNWNFPAPEKLLDRYSKFLITGSCRIVLDTASGQISLKRIDHEGRKHDQYKYNFRNVVLSNMKRLLWIHD